MPMSNQSRKHTIGLAGEFLVAGELLRRGIMAAVTYGNAKQADVVAIHESRATSLEVKSTSESKWVLGGSLVFVPYHHMR
jgi:Holliday junction resolvase